MMLFQRLADRIRIEIMADECKGYYYLSPNHNNTVLVYAQLPHRESMGA